MRKTFEAAKIGDLNFKNRIIRSAKHDGLADGKRSSSSSSSSSSNNEKSHACYPIMVYVV